MQKQDEDFTNSLTICCKVVVPRAGSDEHCSQTFHQEIRSFGPLVAFPTRTSKEIGVAERLHPSAFRGKVDSKGSRPSYALGLSIGG